MIINLTILYWYSQNFGEYNMWLAAENGMFLRSTKGNWMMTMPEHLNMDWVDSIKVRSIFNSRFTLSIWCHNCIFIFELHNLFTACFRVFHGKNSTILYWDSWDITNLELQVCRYASNVHNVDYIVSLPLSYIC